MLHPLEEASKRGVPIITYNPLRERGLESFINPQSPSEMLTGQKTRISSQYYQVKAGGDLAALAGICKFLVQMDDAAQASGGERVLDHAFIASIRMGSKTLSPGCGNRHGRIWSGIPASHALLSWRPRKPTRNPRPLSASTAWG